MDVAREKCPETKFVLSDGESEDLPIPSVDVATAFRFFGNAPDALRNKVLRTIANVLRQGG